MAFQENVLYKNNNLKKILQGAEMLFDAPLTISQISFAAKEPILNHILMIGDTAGLIHPLCGNGMAMAIHSAKIASELIAKQTANHSPRAVLEKEYAAAWQNLFKNRLKFGRILSHILKTRSYENIVMTSLHAMPFILNKIIKHTHGQPITINN